jgi:hypothetical protein
MEKKFSIGYDGFIQIERMYTLEEIKPIWARDIKNRLLYEYDCSVYELDENRKPVRRVSSEELRAS